MLHTSNRFFKINDLQHFSDEAAKKTIFYESTHSAGAVWCLKPGQTLPCHTHKDADDVWIVLQGKGTFSQTIIIKKPSKQVIYLYHFQAMPMV
ncbi:hypothetical protein [Staphylococcus nepalensis]|uniref:hypothetical protein n=1 Tax=Staphylococcus nepalensis TaxID=214473 RepID=UPI0024B77FCD|nr:hypothetical protein [Staphylococcus nepalensis]MDR5650285.1 hypothetical protein [Staphylococcus nepalensis]